MQKNKRLIAKIFNGEEVIMTIDHNMLSFEFGALDRGNLTDVVNWGIYANRGSISFIDNIGYFNNQNVNSSQIKNYIVKFYLAKNQETLIATFKIDAAEFDDETRRVDIQLIGKIIELQNKPSSLEDKDVFTFYEQSAKYLLGLDQTQTDNIERYSKNYPSYGLTFGEDSSIIDGVNIYCAYLKFGTFWDRLSKICEATMCRVIEDENGNPIITGERPKKTSIIVNPKNILSISKGEFVKLINPSIDVTNRKRYINNKVSQADRHLTVNYNEYGDPISISGAEYSIGDWENITGTNGLVISSNRLAEITLQINLPYKTHHISSSVAIESLEIYQNDEKSNDSKETEKPYSFLLKNYDTIKISDFFNVQQSVSNKLTNLKSLDFSFFLNYFEDEEKETLTKVTDDGQEDTSVIDSNDLIQKYSYYYGKISDYIALGEFILNETSRRYANGRECFEIECLFNDYYDENGNNVFSKDDLSTHFKKYDIIIPYVQKRGQTVPLRVNEDGTPKKFRVIGISYSYDGLLKQKLSVQEERYDID